MVPLGWRNNRTNPNLQTTLTLNFLLIIMLKLEIAFPSMLFSIKISILKYFEEIWTWIRKHKNTWKSPQPFLCCFQQFYLRCEKLEISYFENTATVLNKSSKVLKHTSGQLFYFIQKTFLFRKKIYWKVFIFYKNMEIISVYPLHFG